MRPAGAVWLAVHVSIVRRRDVVATAVLAVAVVALTLLGLVTVAAREVASAQRDRAYRVTPRIVPPHRGSRAALEVIEPRALPVRRWHEHDIARSFYSAGSSKLAIPGVSRPPRPGQYYASPALRELMRRDPVVAALFSGKTLVGTIADRGLVQPHELRAVEGVPRRSSFLMPVSGFGSSPSTGLDDNSTLDASVTSIVLLAVWLPGLAVLVIVTRLGSRRRRQRSRALRLLGASIGMTRGINALETIVVALPASALGCVLYRIVSHRMTTVPWTGFGYFPSDAQLGFAAYVAVALIVMTVAGASTAFALRMQAADAGAVNARPPGRIVRFGMVSMALGLAYLFALPALARVFSRATLGLWIACGLVAVGLAVAGPRLVIKIADVCAGHVRAGGALVGLRLSSWGTTTSSRLGSTLCVLIVLVLGSLAFMSLLNGGGSSNWKQALAGHPSVAVVANDFGGALTRSDVLALAPGTGAAQVQNATRRHGRLVVYASCRDLAFLAGTRSRSCAARALPEELRSALLRPPSLAPRRADGHGSRFYLVVRNTRLDETLARLSAHSPSLEFDLGPLGREDPDEKQFPTQLRWLTTGSIAGLLMGVVALLGAGFGDIRERRTRMRGLRILGAPPHHLLQAHYWSTSGPVVILGWLATLSAWLVCSGIATFDDRARIGARLFPITALAVLLTGLAIGTVTLPDALRTRCGRSPSRDR